MPFQRFFVGNPPKSKKMFWEKWKKKYVSIDRNENIQTSFKNEIGIYLEDVNIPGNLGSIIRTCDWFGINNVICSNQSVDAFNPKVVQASMGSLSRISLSYVNTEKFLSEIKKKNINSQGFKQKYRQKQLP